MVYADDSLKSDQVKTFKNQANDLQQRLSKKEIIVDEDGIRIVLTGNQEVKEFFIEGITNDTVIEKLNKAIKLSQEMAAKELANLKLA